MDLPPFRLEMLRLDLEPTPAPAQCRPAPTAPARTLAYSVIEAPPCPGGSRQLRIDEPLGWPPLPPPPLPATTVPPRPAS